MSLIRSNFVRIALVVLPLMLLAIVAWVTLATVPVTISETIGDDTSVTFQLEDRFLLRPGDCTTVSWDTQNIQAMLFNGSGAVGTYTDTYCPGDAGVVPPYWLVKLPNLDVYTFEIPVVIFTDAAPWLGMALGAWVPLVFLAFGPQPVPSPAPDPSRRQFFGVFAALAAFLSVGVLVRVREREPRLVVCGNWIVFDDELRHTDCDRDDAANV